MATVCAAEWTNNNIRKLLDAMKNNIPNPESEKIWSVGLKTFDWSKVAFEPFSAEECCAKWQGIMKKLRKIKTLTELIDDAQDVFDDPVARRKIDLELPKKPASANALFFAENMKKFKKKNPEMSSRQLMKFANDKFQKLSPECKEKYFQQVQKAKEEYNTSMNEFRNPLPKKQQKGDTEGASSNEDDTEVQRVPPPKPPLTGYNLFCREQKYLLSGIPQTEITTVWSQRWKRLSNIEKAEYSRRCCEMKEEYNTRMDEFRNPLPKKQQKGDTEGASSNEDDTKEKLVPPPKPPLTGYNLFCREQKYLLSGIPQTEITTVWSQRWKRLSNIEKAEYSRRCCEMKEEYNTMLNHFLSGLDEKKQAWILKKYHLKKPYPTQKKLLSTYNKEKKSFPGEPKMPAKSISALYLKRQMTEMRGAVKDRFAKANRRFKSLSEKEKEQYQAEIKENMQTYAVELRRWFETLTATQQQEFCEHNPKKLVYLRCKSGLRTSHHRTSDSEDEVLEDNDSDDVTIIEQDEGDEEEEDAIMFELY